MHEFWMRRALLIAKIAYSKNKLPIGAVLIKKNFEIGIGFNLTELQKYSFSHAEINALKQGSFYTSNHYLNDCILYITLEPCFLCLSSVIYSKIKYVVFAAYYTDKIKNTLKMNYINKIKLIGGILEFDAKKLLNNFFDKYQ